MAVFTPEYELILKDQMERHTAGELLLLKKLQALDDTYSVYYQPHINFAHPDIVIVKEGCGVLIIEVKDWNIRTGAYGFHKGENRDKFGYITIKDQPSHLKTPFEQVSKYKDELYSVWSPKLNKANRQGKTVIAGETHNPAYGIVKTGVFFSEASDVEVLSLFGHESLGKRNDIKVYDRYYYYWTKKDIDRITEQIKAILKKGTSYTAEIHEEVSSLFSLSKQWKEQMRPIELTQQQKRWAECERGEWRRLRGGAGSGKTVIIAQKAINCYRIKKKPVLILTYNITLKNYIRDIISANTRDMSKQERASAFEIIHYDEFLPQMIQKYGLKEININQYKNKYGEIDERGWKAYRKAQEEILEQISGRLERYETVLVDEAQDFEGSWFQFLKDHFIADNADYLVVADEKQNIYGREMDEEDKLPRISGMKGAWNKLKESHRMTQRGLELALAYQHAFFTDKYSMDTLQRNIDMLDDPNKRVYCQIDDFDAEKVYQLVSRFQGENKINPNDICILVSGHDKMRRLEKVFQDSGKEVQTICESQKEYNQLLCKYNLSSPDIDEIERRRRKAGLNSELSQIRHIKKSVFYMNPGVIKLCTVHSFKGWEIDTVVLIIDKSDNKDDKVHYEALEREKRNTDEIIYTAITRSRSNLLVINCGNMRYHSFFKKEMQPMEGV